MTHSSRRDAIRTALGVFTVSPLPVQMTGNSTGITIATFGTFESARQARAIPHATCVFIAGGTRPGDGAEGWFQCRAGPGIDDGGVTLQTSDGALLVRIFSGPVSVAWFGAFGDGRADDTDAIQRAVRSNREVFFPPGTYRVTRSIILASPSPWGAGSLAGSGGLVGDPRTTRRPRNHTAIVWDGEPGGTLIDATGVIGVEIRSLSLIGRMLPDSATRAGTLYRSRNSPGTPAFGSGESVFRLVQFVDADVALKCGEKKDDGNAAGFTFEKCNFLSLESGLQINNSQGVNYLFLHCSAGFTRHVIDALEGGQIQWVGGNLYHCGSEAEDGYAFRLRNTGYGNTNTFVNLRVEQQTYRTLQVIGEGIVSMVGYSESQSSQDRSMFDIRGARLSLRSSLIASTCAESNGAVIMVSNHRGGQRGSVVIEDCTFLNARLLSEIVQPRALSDDAQVVLSRCISGRNGTPIPFASNRLEAGSIQQYAVTRSNRSAVATFSGWPPGRAASVQLPLQQMLSLRIEALAVSLAGHTYGPWIHQITVLRHDARKPTVIQAPLPSAPTDTTAPMIEVEVSEGGDRLQVRCIPNLETPLEWHVRIVP